MHRAQLFSPLDLYEEKNVPKVVHLLLVFAELAKKRGFETVLQHLNPLDVEFTEEEVHRAEEILSKAEQPIPLPTPLLQPSTLPPPEPQHEQTVEQVEQPTSQAPEPPVELPPVFKPEQVHFSFPFCLSTST